MAFTKDDGARLSGMTVIGEDGRSLGTVDAVYYSNDDHTPKWVAVSSGLFGTRLSMVPLARAAFCDEGLSVPFDKERLKQAPHHDPGQELTPAEEADLLRHYGISYVHVDDIESPPEPDPATRGPVAAPESRGLLGPEAPAR
ncbi:MAG TPA: PRC-barrel domain-containing protein [Pseudonocardia sp.]|nr:PRC-barrel domain-containing protein [Pseudonocardia sp.]